ncbi:Ap6Ahydrolase [Aspergillus parasiticus SU-1]|uniref:Ap6Ahydrolase n=1 Tax=Aspergillus parasiticus (strain ATCC 56775 / NRRL 5862 / SRRC 143 / SU-1) TaxID=1403190 RepID=A0A0F0I6B0_ASPPU|nr:Ap6Ahydrolase [Aspergillus parasiticus SU-1]
MVTSPNITTQYTSNQFVESCGAILFDLSSPEKTVCLIHYHAKNEWLLAKGRRNCGESRHEAALREVREETGYQTHLHPVTMYTRAPLMDEQGHMPDEPRCYPDLTEPFIVTIRQLGRDGIDGVKIIWWYIAALDEGVVAGSAGKAEEEFTARFFPLGEAVEKLSFRDDRAVLQKAIALVEAH